MAIRRPSLGVVAFAHLCELLNSRVPHSKKWFQDQIGVGGTTMTKFMRILRNRKLIYVADWTTDGRRVSTRIALWTWGYNREDVLRPPVVPKSIIDRNSKLRRKQRESLSSKPPAKTNAQKAESFACERSADLR